jgi:hypothetical protein
VGVLAEFEPRGRWLAEPPTNRGSPLMRHVRQQPAGVGGPADHPRASSR